MTRPKNLFHEVLPANVARLSVHRSFDYVATLAAKLSVKTKYFVANPS